MASCARCAATTRETKKVFENATRSARSTVFAVEPQCRSMRPSPRRSNDSTSVTGSNLTCNGVFRSLDNCCTMAWHSAQLKPPGLPAASRYENGAASRRTPSVMVLVDANLASVPAAGAVWATAGSAASRAKVKTERRAMETMRM